MVDDRIAVPVNANRNESPMVILTDNNDEFSIFPPINHENLHLFTNHQIPNSQSQSQSQSPPSSPPSPYFSTSDYDTCVENPSLSPSFDLSLRKGGDFIGWLSIGFQILRSKLVSTVSSFRSRGGANWSFGLRAATLVIFVMVLIMRKMRNRRRNLTANESRLMQIIMEKEGKIAQLLHQIAQMNEILIDRHKALAAKVVQ